MRDPSGELLTAVVVHWLRGAPALVQWMRLMGTWTPDAVRAMTFEALGLKRPGFKGNPIHLFLEVGHACVNWPAVIAAVDSVPAPTEPPALPAAGAKAETWRDRPPLI